MTRTQTGKPERRLPSTSSRVPGGTKERGRPVASISVTERARPTAIRAAWLFDGTQAALRPDPVVVIEGSTILSVGLGVAPPTDAHVVDLGGATLMPGLIDTHVHLAFDASTDPVGALAGEVIKLRWRPCVGLGGRRSWVG
jgi:hypothetical protein